MPLSPLAPKQSSRASVVPRGIFGRLGTIREVGAEAEFEECQKEAEKEKEKYNVRKIRFEDHHLKPENNEKE